MKKILFFAALVLGMASCQTEPEGLDVMVGGEQEVMLNVSLPESTRSASSAGFDFTNFENNGNYDLRFILEIAYNNGTETKVVREVKTSETTSTTFPVRLVPERNYTFTVWADLVKQGSNGADLYYNILTEDANGNVPGLSNITFKEWTPNVEARDAYTYTDTFKFGENPEKLKMTLTRPFAKVRVVATDIADVTKFGIKPESATVAYTTDLYTAFDAVNGTVITTGAEKKSHSFVYANVDTYEATDSEQLTVFADYIFVPEHGTVQFNLNVYANEAYGDLIKSNSFSTAIPVEKNKVTSIVGDVLTKGGNVSVTVDGSLGQKETINYVDNAESLQEIINNSEENESVNITLGDDIDLGALAGILSTRAAEPTYGLLIPAGKSVVLDLNGCTISQTKECTANYSMIVNKGNLTITDNSVAKNGTISFKDTGAGDPTFGWGSYTLRNEGTLVVENGTIKHLGEQNPGNGQPNVHMYCAIFQYSGKSTINGGVISTHTYRSARLWSGDMTINGGEFEGQLWLQAVNNNSKLTINGGTFAPRGNDGSSVFVTNDTYTVNFAVNGGHFTTKIGMSKPFGCITGGTFTTAAKENTAAALINDDYAWVEAEGLWTLARKADVAKIGEVGYTSLAKAVAAVKDGETITLVSDITLANIAVLAECENVVLDGNGKTLTSTAGRAINVSGAQNVTIKDLTINASGERAINIIQNSTNITIENVTATAANYTVNVASSAPGAVVAIKNSTLNGLCTVNVASAGANVTVDGSTVNCNDNNTTEGEAYAALSLNKEAVDGKIIATNSTINVTEGSDSTAGRNGAEDGVVTINGSVEGVVVMNAVITYPDSDYYYSFETIQAAVDFAKSGDKISLIRNVELTETLTISEGKNVVLDGNGKTLKSSASRAINVSGANDVTIKNLNIVASGERAINVIQNSKKVTIENVTATAANYTVNVAGSAPGAVVAIKNSTLNGLCTVNVASAGANVTVDGSTVNCNDNNTTEGESYAALCLNKDAVDGKIIATNSTINVTEGSDSTAGRNGAEDGVVTINGSVEGVVVMNAVITYPDSNYYYSFETIQAAVDFAKSGDKISLIRDVELTETLTISEGKNIVLDLNGKTLAAVDKNTIKNNGGNLTLKNGTVTRTGDAVGYSVNNASGEISVVDATVERGLYTSGSKMTATNANISHEQSSRHAIYAWNCEVTINSGTFHNDNAGNATLMASGSSVVTINGGTFSIADGRSALGWTSSMIDQNSTAQVIVKGGLFNGGFRINSADTTLTIEGGEFNTNNGSAFTDYSGTKVVKGGKFTDAGAQNWAKKYIAEGYEMNANGVVVAK